MGRKRKGPRITWRNGRAYGEFWAYEDVGGGREALSPPGQTWATTDQDIAEELFTKRLAELKGKRKNRAGVERSTTLARLARDHLKQKAEAGQTSDRHLTDIETRLKAAADHFGRERDPRSIMPEDVREWLGVLAASDNGRGGTLAPVTQRNYLFALSGLYRRAQEGRYVAPGYNPVGIW